MLLWNYYIILFVLEFILKILNEYKMVGVFCYIECTSRATEEQVSRSKEVVAMGYWERSIGESTNGGGSYLAGVKKCWTLRHHLSHIFEQVFHTRTTCHTNSYILYSLEWSISIHISICV